jgi:hypothetical protein
MFRSLKSDAGPDDFVPLLNSIYNLLANSAPEDRHPERTKYLPDISEAVMVRRTRIEHEVDQKELLFSIRPVGDFSRAAESVASLYPRSLSNALTGYSYRTVEEMVCKQHSNPLSDSDRQRLMTRMYAECADALNQPGDYAGLNPKDPIDSRLLFCLALRWDNQHLAYVLSEDDWQERMWKSIFAESLRLSEDCFRQVFAVVGLIGCGGRLTGSLKETVVEWVEQDLIHGYIVKLAESLYPF